MIGIQARIEATRTLAALEKYQSDLTTVSLYKLVGQRMLKWVNDNFKAEGLEEKWPPLSPKTIARRRAGSIKLSQGARKSGRKMIVGSAINLSGAKPLQDTGRLKQSFFADSFHDRLIAGTQSNYAAFHHFGTKRGIPKRPLLPSDALMQTIGEHTILAELVRLEKRINQELK